MKRDSELAAVSPVEQKQSSSTEEVLVNATTTVNTSSSTAETANIEEEGKEKKIPFGEFMSKGGSYKCTVTQKMANMLSEGTVYMHDQLVRVEFSTTLAGQSMSTTMIARDGYNYSWTSMTPGKGYKTKIVNTTTDSSASPSGTYTWNGGQVTSYSCATWVADDSIFVLPKNIVFSLSQ